MADVSIQGSRSGEGKIKGPGTYVAAVLLFGSGYLAVAKLGMLFATLNENASPVWPATGYALALLYALGIRLWPAIFFGAFLANFGTAHVLAVTGIATGNTLEAVVGIFLIQHLPFRRYFLFHAESFAILAAGLVASCVSASLGVTSLFLLKAIPASVVSASWITWWIGDLLGAWVVFPLLVSAADLLDAAEWRKRRLQLAQRAFSIFVVVCAIACIAVMSWRGIALFLVFPLLLYVSQQYERFIIQLTAFLICVVSILATIYGYGPFQGGNFNQNLLNLQLILSSVAVSALILGDLKVHVALRETRVILLGGWLLGGVLFLVAQQWEQERDRSQLLGLVKDAEERLQAKMNVYENALRGGASLFVASKTVERDEWRRYTLALQLTDRFPGIHGFGFVAPVPFEKAAAWEAQVRKDGAPEFHIHSHPTGDHLGKELYVIKLVEPMDQNREALGLDLASDFNRREAADRARQTGFLTISENIRLVQDSKLRLGFLAYIPIFDPDRKAHSVDSKDFMGWIYAPFIAENFFGAALGGTLQDLNLSLLDPQTHLTVLHFGEDTRPRNIFDRITTLELGQRKFVLGWRRSETFLSRRESTSALFGALSAVITLFLAGSMTNLQILNQRAGQLANERTLQLRLLFRTTELLARASTPEEVTTFACQVVKEELNWPDCSFRPADAPGPAHATPGMLSVPVRSGERLHGTMDFKTEEYAETENGLLGTLTEIGARMADRLERLEADASLRAQQRLLMQTSKMSALGEMSGGIAHEINNPLAIIHGRAALLKESVTTEPVPPGEIVRSMETVMKTVERIAKIIRGLRAFARQSEADPFASVPISQIIQNTLELCSERFRSNDIAMYVSDIPDIYVQCREAQISQVLLNLLNNAFDAVKGLDSRWVRIEVVQKLQTIEISVTDSGVGIRPEIADKIIQPFFTTKSPGEGTGLGLSISLGIAQEHRGTLALDRSAKNTRFVVTLPITMTETEA